jgi:hypothetical protein
VVPVLALEGEQEQGVQDGQVAAQQQRASPASV